MLCLLPLSDLYQLQSSIVLPARCIRERLACWARDDGANTGRNVERRVTSDQSDRVAIPSFVDDTNHGHSLDHMQCGADLMNCIPIPSWLMGRPSCIFPRARHMMPGEEIEEWKNDLANSWPGAVQDIHHSRTAASFIPGVDLCSFKTTRGLRRSRETWLWRDFGNVWAQDQSFHQLPSRKNGRLKNLRIGSALL